MKSIKTLSVLMLSLLLFLVVLVPLRFTEAQVRTPNLQIQHSNSASCFAALLAGDIDIMGCPLSASQYAVAITDPNILLGPVLMNDMFSYDLNCNETIAAYPGVNSPTSYWQFRAALALLTDKQYIVNSICGGFADRMDVPIPPNAPTWLNKNVIYPNYPWECNSSRAIQMLDGAGFVEGSTLNPYYNPEIPWSAHQIRVYPQWTPVHDNPHIGTDLRNPPYVYNLTLPVCQPVWENLKVEGVLTGEEYYEPVPYTWTGTGHVRITVSIALTNCTYLWMEYNTTHPKAGEDLDPVVFYARSDNPLMLAVGTLLANNMRVAGIPVQFTALPLAGTAPPVVEDRNYHIYTGYQLLDRYPTSMYKLYHSSWWFPNGSNYIAPPCPRPEQGPSAIDPNYDIYLKDIYHAESIPEAIFACQNAQSIHVMKAVNIPLWCTLSYYAWRSWVLGVVNEMGYGLINDYTFMNAYKCACAPHQAPHQGTMIVGVPQAPLSQNILFAQSTYDYVSLDRIWPKGQAVNPYDIGRDQPWIVQDWTVGTWDDNGTIKSKVIYWLRKDVSWAAPVTGDRVRSFTAHDVEFSNMFSYAFPDGTHWNNAKDIDHIQIVDNYTFIVYFSSVSYWFQYAANYPYLPKNEWGDLFCTVANYTELGANIPPGGEIILYGDLVAQVQNVTVNGLLFTDYWVRFNSTGVCSANRIYFPHGVFGDLVINYWNITGDPHGYYPGGVMGYTWTDTFFSCGQYIAAGGSASLTCNDFFFLETPPLGEVDWYWWWDARDTSRPFGGPRTGYFEVDIYDVTFTSVSYGSTSPRLFQQSNAPPWFPGADLAPSYTTEVPCGGMIDIYDVTTILVSYGRKFGEPPTGPDP